MRKNKRFYNKVIDLLKNSRFSQGFDLIAEYSPTLSKFKAKKFKIAKRVKSISDIYVTASTNSKIQTIFNVDKRNLLLSNSDYGMLLEKIAKHNLDNILNLTNLTNINILRRFEDKKEIACSLSFRGNNNIFLVPTYVNNINKREDKKLSSLFTQRKFIQAEKTEILSMMLTDYMSYSRFRDKFIYDIELEFSDGIYSFLEERYNFLKNNLTELKKVFNFLNNSKIFLTNGNYDIAKLSRIKSNRFITGTRITSNPAYTIQQIIDIKLLEIIMAYADVSTIQNEETQIDNSKILINSLYNSLSTTTGNYNNFEPFINTYEDFLSELDKKIYITNKDYNSMHIGKKTRKEKIHRRTIKVTKVSEEVYPGTYEKVLINPLKDIVQYEKDFFPTLRPTSGGISRLSKISGPQEMIIDKNVYDLTYDFNYNFILLNNQIKGLLTNKTKNFPITSRDRQDYRKGNLITRQVQFLDSLSNIGISVNTIKSVQDKEKSNEFTDISENTYSNSGSVGGFNVSVNTGFNPLPISYSSYVFQELETEDSSSEEEIQQHFLDQLKFPDLLASCVVIKNLLSNNIKPDPTNISGDLLASEYFKKLLSVRIQYLDSYVFKKEVNTFKEKWLDFTESSVSNLSIGDKKLCRIIFDSSTSENTKNIKQDNIVLLNKYFMLSIDKNVDQSRQKITADSKELVTSELKRRALQSRR